MNSIAEKTNGVAEKAEHTPGPWEIEPKERREYPLYVMDKEGDRIARCDGLNAADLGPNPQQCKANARLIVAAPTLLSAAKEARKLLGYQSGSNPEYEKVWRQVTDAIAMAEPQFIHKADQR